MKALRRIGILLLVAFVLLALPHVITRADGPRPANAGITVHLPFIGRFAAPVSIPPLAAAVSSSPTSATMRFRMP